MSHSPAGDQPRVLDAGLLDEFEDVMLRRAPEQHALLAVPMSDAALDSRARALGLWFPRELRLWWKRYGDCSPVPMPDADSYTAEALDGLIAHYEMRLRLAREAAQRHQAPDPMADREHWWPVGWLPIFNSGGSTVRVADCGVEHNAPVPIWAIDWHVVLDDGGLRWPIAPSLGDQVAQWTANLASGRYDFDARSQLWRRSN